MKVLGAFQNIESITLLKAYLHWNSYLLPKRLIDGFDFDIKDECIIQHSEDKNDWALQCSLKNILHILDCMNDFQEHRVIESKILKHSERIMLDPSFSDIFINPIGRRTNSIHYYYDWIHDNHYYYHRNFNDQYHHRNNNYEYHDRNDNHQYNNDKLVSDWRPLCE